MRICLDTSTLNRPFDDQRQPRILLETQALLTILNLVEDQKIELTSSVALTYENNRNTSPTRRQWVEQCLKLSTLYQPLSDSISNRVTALGLEGIKPLDALHIACSEEAGCDYFLTCDDRLVRRYAGSLSVINPVTFVLEITGDGE